MSSSRFTPQTRRDRSARHPIRLGMVREARWSLSKLPRTRRLNESRPTTGYETRRGVVIVPNRPNYGHGDVSLELCAQYCRRPVFRPLYQLPASSFMDALMEASPPVPVRGCVEYLALESKLRVARRSWVRIPRCRGHMVLKV